MKKRILVVFMLFCLLLTGCGGYDEVTALSAIEALNSNAEGSSFNYNLSYADEQEMIYAQVIDRQLLDLSTLDSCSDSEVQQVINYMNRVDEQLIGNVSTLSYQDETTKYFLQDLFDDDAVINSSFTDYLLTFFEKTPYYWQRESTIIRGIDAESRSIVVDVTYKTIDFLKAVKLDSTIVRGEPNYDTMVSARFEKWLQILSIKTTDPTNPILPLIENEFYTHYGDVNYIIAEQRSLSPTALLYETGNQVTYTGLTDSEQEQLGASCTVRYVLVPEYVLGINLGVTCKHMYITDYKLDTDFTADLKPFTEEGYATITDSVYNLIYRYFTCIDEADYEGLYKLTHNFHKLDKHYYDYFTTSHRKHDGFSVSLFDITGTHITCGVVISSKERSKGAEIAFPSYTDKYYVELELLNGVLKVKNMVLVSRKLEGEPSIGVEDADVVGFGAKIELDNDDRLDIESLICNFSALQLAKDTSSIGFENIVDISVSEGHLTALKTAMTSLSGVRKVVWLQNYQQGLSNYASVKCKELFQDEINAIVEAEVIYDFILKGGVWYVYNYNVNSSVRLDTTNLNTTGSLCLVSPGKVDAYTSQIKGSTSVNLDAVADTSVVFMHEAYVPTLKDGHAEQGLVKFKYTDLTPEIFDSITVTLRSEEPLCYADYEVLMKDLVTASEDLSNIRLYELADVIDTRILELMASLYNIYQGRYTVIERYNEVKSELAETDAVLTSISLMSDTLPSQYIELLEQAELWLNSLKFQISSYGED